MDGLRGSTACAAVVRVQGEGAPAAAGRMAHLARLQQSSPPRGRRRLAPQLLDRGVLGGDEGEAEELQQEEAHERPALRLLAGLRHRVDALFTRPRSG